MLLYKKVSFPFKYIFLEADVLRNKVKAMGRMMVMIKTLREEREGIV